MKKSYVKNLMPLLLLVSILLLWMPVFSVSAAGDSWYVSTTGSDSTGTGTIGSPFKTLQRAINASTTGNNDIIYIRGGTYNATGMTGDRGYYVNKDSLTISNYPGETPILDGTLATGGDYDAGYGVISIGLGGTGYSNVTIQGLTIQHVKGDYGIIYYSGSTTATRGNDFKILNCRIYNMSNYAFFIYNRKVPTIRYIERVEVANNSFENIQTSYSTGEGVAFVGVSNWTYRFNTMADCKKNGLCISNNTRYGNVYGSRFYSNATVAPSSGSCMIGGEGSQTSSLNASIDHINVYNNYVQGYDIAGISFDAAEQHGHTDNISIYNNYVVMSSTGTYDSHGIMIIDVHAHMRIDDVTIKHNTVVLNDADGGCPMYIENVYEGWANRIVIANNIFMVTESVAKYAIKSLYIPYPSTHVTVENNLFWDTDTSTASYWNGVVGTSFGSDALIVDPLLTGYVLSNSSPCVGVADSAYPVTYDYVGTTRPQGGTYDIGAYEYDVEEEIPPVYPHEPDNGESQFNGVIGMIAGPLVAFAIVFGIFMFIKEHWPL